MGGRSSAPPFALARFASGCIVNADIDGITDSLLPRVASCLAGERPYNSAHCMAVYHPPPREEISLQLPAILIGETVAQAGPPCTLLEGIPASPPGGSVVVGTTEDFRALAPHLIEGLPALEDEEAYAIRFDRFALVAAQTHEGVLRAAHSFVQIVAVCPETLVPGMLIHDEPTFAYRSLVYDLRTHEVRAEHLTRVVALLGSFKGNRLHLHLDAHAPLSTEARPGSAVYDDAVTIGQTCFEYGVVPVPWADLVARVARGELPAGQACEMALDLTNAFETDAIGLGSGPLPAAADLPAVRGFLRNVLDRCSGVPELYLDAIVLGQLYADVEAPDGLVAAVRDLGRAADELAMLEKRGIPAAVHVSSGAQGFVPPARGRILETTDAAMGLAYAGRAVEVGFRSDELVCGHVWENDLFAWVACVTQAWQALPAADEAAAAFADLAFAEDGSMVRQMVDTVAQAFPAVLRTPEVQALREMAFGRSAPREAWQRLGALAWPAIEEGLTQAERAVRDCRNRVERNATILDQADLGLTALRFLAAQNTLFRQAHEHYVAAREGRSGRLHLAHAALENLLGYVPLFTARLQSVKIDSGACVQELEWLTDFQERLERLCQALRKAEYGGALLPPAEVGFPPIDQADEQARGGA